MGLSHEHEIHRRRFGRNAGLGVVLGSFVVLVFLLSIVKISNGEPTEAFDHTIRVDQLQASE